MSDRRALMGAVSGSGGDTIAFQMTNVQNANRQWQTPDIGASFAGGYYLECKFLNETPATDAENMISFGYAANLSGWSTDRCVHLYYCVNTDTLHYLRVRNASVTVDYLIADPTVPHIVRVDSSGVYLDGVFLQAIHANVVNCQSLAFGSIQGTKRYVGTFEYVKLVSH